MNPQSTASQTRAKRAASNGLLTVRVEEAGRIPVRFSIPRQAGNAVSRNRLRRQLREIVRKWPPRSGISLLIRASETERSFQELEEMYLQVIREMDLVDG